MAIPLSVLDLVPLPQGLSSGEAMRNSVDLARKAEGWGYRRVWYAEHHNMPTIASTTPEIMIALAGAATSTIRVGSGGVMLPNHAPLKVAESFKMLEALYPDRVDLGIGRAPGTDPATAVALRGSRAALGAEDFPERLGELFALGVGPVPTRLGGTTAAMPPDAPLPPVFILGSSSEGRAGGRRDRRGLRLRRPLQRPRPAGPPARLPPASSSPVPSTGPTRSSPSTRSSRRPTRRPSGSPRASS